MATITAGGIATGLDVNGIVSQLMALERRPLEQLEQRESVVRAQISAYGSLRSALSAFSSAMQSFTDVSKFQPYTASTNYETRVTATLGEGALPGRYSLNVTRLAGTHKLSSAAYAAGATVGTGTLNFSVDGTVFSVAIDATNNTLEGIRDTINAASGNTKVTASVINSASGPMLLLSANESGAANAISVSVTGDGDGNNTNAAGLSALSYTTGASSMMQRTPAQDAALTIDGIQIYSPTNNVGSAIEGVTFNLLNTGAVSISVSRDNSAITAAAQDFAKAYNDLRDALSKLRNGDLANDGVLRSIESSLSDALDASSVTGGSFSYLPEIGISRDRTGKMQVDAGRLGDALGTDPTAVISLFTHVDSGAPMRLKTIVESLMGSGGLISGREEGLNSRIRSLEDQQSRVERRLATIEKSLRAQFTALDSLVSQLQGTGAFLTQQLSAQSGSNS
jgi:flagellar hook-associated protein 2